MTISIAPSSERDLFGRYMCVSKVTVSVSNGAKPPTKKVYHTGKLSSVQKSEGTISDP